MAFTGFTTRIRREKPILNLNKSKIMTAVNLLKEDSVQHVQNGLK
jgi:hypothetical protein